MQREQSVKTRVKVGVQISSILGVSTFKNSTQAACPSLRVITLVSTLSPLFGIARTVSFFAPTSERCSR